LSSITAAIIIGMWGVWFGLVVSDIDNNTFFNFVDVLYLIKISILFN
jgi:hypothetical protein